MFSVKFSIFTGIVHDRIWCNDYKLTIWKWSNQNQWKHTSMLCLFVSFQFFFALNLGQTWKIMQYNFKWNKRKHLCAVSVYSELLLGLMGIFSFVFETWFVFCSHANSFSNSSYNNFFPPYSQEQVRVLEQITWIDDSTIIFNSDKTSDEIV